MTQARAIITGQGARRVRAAARHRNRALRLGLRIAGRMTPQIGVSPPLKDMVDRFTHIFFGRWFVLLFFGAQGYWQVKGLFRDTSAGRGIPSPFWIALGVLL